MGVRPLTRFNPLHCGAVVASRARALGAGVGPQVSIPFIAGQWSLPQVCGAPHQAWTRFNPLHCGAVVASRPALRGGRRADRRFNPLHCGAVVASLVANNISIEYVQVSIPFTAGQWSLHIGSLNATCRDVILFQSPSLRGSGRFPRGDVRHPGPNLLFQSPSLRGSGRFAKLWLRNLNEPKGFQSPSLRGSGRFGRMNGCGRSGTASFNPLHCGAVVASGSGGRSTASMSSWFQSPSLRGSGRFGAGKEKQKMDLAVSIPFTAGQWSLRQRFVLHHIRMRIVSIPFTAGQWSLPYACTGANYSQYSVSIPFTAGQWSLHCGGSLHQDIYYEFQSPSLRGSGRFQQSPKHLWT